MPGGHTGDLNPTTAVESQLIPVRLSKRPSRSVIGLFLYRQ